MENFISDLPNGLQWRILSFLPHKVLTQLNLSNKGAWLVFNSSRIKSEEWNEQVNWMSKLINCRLTVSEKLFIFTLSDLHRHTKSAFSCCPYYKVPAQTTFELLPLQDVQPTLSIGGFVLKSTKCLEIPWCNYRKLRETKNRFSCSSIPKSSPVYTFLERELAYDQHIQRAFDNWREEDCDAGDDDQYNGFMDYHMELCADCDTSGSEYAPDEDDSDTDPSDMDSEVSLNELIELRDAYKQTVDENEKSRAEKHRKDVEEWMERSLQKWERGDISSDEYEYNPFTDSVYSTKRRFNRKPPNEEIRQKYCHNFNNSGMCHIGKNCWFRHEKAPICKDDIECKAVNCGFYHNPKPLKSCIELLEEMDGNITRLKEKNLEAKAEGLERSGEDVEKAGKCGKETRIDDEGAEETGNHEDADVKDWHSNESADEVSTSDDLDDNMDVDECSSADSLWVEFLKNHQKPDEQFRLDNRRQKHDEFWRMRRVYIKNHGPFPHAWLNEIPKETKLPLFFILSAQPRDMGNVKVRNKQEVRNIIVWDVYEENEVKSESRFLGYTVLFRDTHDWILPANFEHFAFGDATLMAIGIVQSTFENYCWNNNPIVGSFKELEHDPTYFCSTNEKNFNMAVVGEDNSDYDSGDDD